VPIGRKTSQPVVQSCCNIFLERTWHRESRSDFELMAHAKFNADAMNGIQIMAKLEIAGKLSQSIVSSFKIYRVAEASWAETLVYTSTPTEASPGVYLSYITQANLSANELSGMETYAIEILATRRRRTFKKKIWVNHLGCFDSILRLKNEASFLNLTKLDE
jgi:hypothetical protein